MSNFKHSRNVEIAIICLSNSARRAPSLKLMLVGLNGRGKSTLLSHLKYVGKTKCLPVTFRQRLETMSADERNSYANGKQLAAFI